MNNDDKKDILEAIGMLAEHMQGIQDDVSCLKTDVAGLKADMRHVKATMVTKDYLDDKLADFHSDVVTFVKRRVPCWTDVPCRT